MYGDAQLTALGVERIELFDLAPHVGADRAGGDGDVVVKVGVPGRQPAEHEEEGHRRTGEAARGRGAREGSAVV